ncbi:hypothetical protein [Paraburkholderia sp. Cpub6]|uniref:hypothetical protein n=1 Tax=Paraburkholderia sp. Cpub6 TaxID=2723094 RepID=UPI00160B5AE2|nr:hypothetical protein [Paraburkholderia sp. Cpub6]MBB5462293.1 hypothetical protein [Paraburkholderia sp. Cpub6]
MLCSDRSHCRRRLEPWAWQYYLGKRGDEASQEASNEAASLRKAYEELFVAQATGKTIRKNIIIVDVLTVYDQICALKLTGEPDDDWRAVRDFLRAGYLQAPAGSGGRRKEYSHS